MHLFLLKPRGFCAGVKRAIQTVEKALQLFGPPIYVKHQIVHNRHVVKELEEKGAIFIEDLNLVPDGEKIIYSAHGVSPKVRQAALKKGLKEIDATCPLVNLSHAAAKKYARLGYKILLVGHKDHIEVVGIKEEAENETFVIESLKDVEKLNFSLDDKLFCLMQTTLSQEKTDQILGALKTKYPQLKTPSSSSICYATLGRQRALFSILDKIDAAFVIGDPTSSNSNRLKEIASKKVAKAFLIYQEDEIRPEFLKDVEFLALTAGASTPEKIVQNCVAKLKSMGVSSVEEVICSEEEASFPLPI